MILQGQVWRIITFVMVPPSTNLILCVILLYVYYMLGRQMEGILGTFRFNVFIFQGIILHVLGSLLVYVATRGSYRLGPDTQYLILSMFSCLHLCFRMHSSCFILLFPLRENGWLLLMPFISPMRLFRDSCRTVLMRSHWEHSFLF